MSRVRTVDPVQRCITAWAEEERDLITNIQGVEREIAWMDGQKKDLLQQRRRTRIAEGELSSSESSFYGSHADVNGDASLSSEDDETNVVPSVKKGVKKQVTLANFFVCGEDCGTKEDESSGATQYGNGKEEHGGEDEYHDSWEDALSTTRPASLVLTTMNEYRAATKKSESAVGGAWKRATATKREMDEDDGLYAMTDLLDEAMHSSTNERFVGEQYEFRGLDDGGDMHQPMHILARELMTPHRCKEGSCAYMTR